MTEVWFRQSLNFFNYISLKWKIQEFCRYHFKIKNKLKKQQNILSYDTIILIKYIQKQDFSSKITKFPHCTAHKCHVICFDDIMHIQ